MSRDGYQIGDVVKWHFVPGIIVASFFASLVGTLLTVELLHRKRLGKSLISRYVKAPSPRQDIGRAFG